MGCDFDRAKLRSQEDDLLVLSVVRLADERQEGSGDADLARDVGVEFLLQDFEVAVHV